MTKEVFRAEKGVGEETVAKPKTIQQEDNNTVILDQPVTGQQQVVTTPSSDQQHQDNYIPYVDWDRAMKEGKSWGLVASDKNYRLKDHNYSYVDLRNNYNEWAKRNGYPELSVYDFMAYTQDKDISKSPEDNEKAERRKKWEDASEQLGYMLTNLGNFIGAGLGAPEPTNAPDSVQLTERQQRLRDKTDALRRAYNKDWLQAYTKQKAADRQAELDKANAEHKATQDELARRKQEDLERRTAILEFNAQVNKEFKDAKTRNDERITEIKVALAQGQINLNQARAALTNIKASVEAGGKTVEKRNADGSVTVTTTTPNTNGKRTPPNRVKKRLPNK